MIRDILHRRVSASIMAGLIVAAVTVIVISQPAVVAAPAFVTPSWSGGFGSVSSGAVTVATTAGNTVVVTVGTKITTCTVNTVTDNAAGGSSTYTRKVGPVANTGNFEIWGTAVASAKAATSVTVALTGAGSPCKMAFSVAQYSGVTNYGNTNTATGATANPTVSTTLQEANGMMIGGFNTDVGTAPTALTGSLRQAPCSTGGAGSTQNCDSLIDNTAGSTGSLTVAETRAAIAWAGGILELRNQTPCTTAPTVTFPGGQTTVHFTNPLATTTNFAPDGQTSGTPVLAITQNGPGSCAIKLNLATASPAGTTLKYATTSTPPGVGVNTVPVTPSTVTPCASAATGTVCNVWLWTDNQNAAVQAGFSITLTATEA